MYKELKNKVAVITGSYGDIGNAIAKKFRSNGIRLALLGRNLEKLETQKSNLEKNTGTEIIIKKIDVSDYQSYENCVKAIYETWGQIDILVNNAGITKDNIIVRMTDEQWSTVIDTNLKGTFIGCKIISKYMIKQKYGKIINISSIVGQIGNKGQVNYVASKAGIDGITKTLSKELGSRGINVNSIAPGYIETNMTNSLSDNIKNELYEKIPLKRFGNSKEVASLVNFLVSNEASYITGQIINLDGGMTT